MRRDWRCWMSMLVLLFGMVAGAQTDRSVFVMVQSKQDRAADQRYGPDAHLGLESLVESAFFKELKAKYPCIHYLDMSAAKTMLDVDRQRGLLGNEDDTRLAEIGAAVGARYMVAVSVTGVGDQVYLNGTVLDTKTTAVLSRLNTVTAGGNAAAGPIEQFAKKLVNGMSRGPQCPGGWKGTVTVTTTEQWQDDRRKTSEDGKATLTCQILGAGADARCTYQSDDELKGKDGSLVTSKVAKDTPTWISVSVSGDKLGLSIGVIPVTVTRTGVIPIAPTTESINGGSFALPASADANRQSGMWTDLKSTERIRTTVTWSLTKQ